MKFNVITDNRIVEFEAHSFNFGVAQLLDAVIETCEKMNLTVLGIEYAAQKQNANEVKQMGNKPNFRAIVKVGEKRWSNIGVGWGKDGKVTVHLDQTPVPENGKIKFLLVPQNPQRTPVYGK